MLLIELYEKRLDQAWEQYKKEGGLSFRTKAEETNAYNIFLNGAKWAMEDLRELLNVVEMTDGQLPS